MNCFVCNLWCVYNLCAICITMFEATCLGRKKRHWVCGDRQETGSIQWWPTMSCDSNVSHQYAFRTVSVAGKLGRAYIVNWYHLPTFAKEPKCQWIHRCYGNYDDVETGKYHSSHSTQFEIASVSASHCITLPMDELGVWFSYGAQASHIWVWIFWSSTLTAPANRCGTWKKTPFFHTKNKLSLRNFPCVGPTPIFWMVYHVNISQHPFDSLPKYCIIWSKRH